MAFGYYGGYQYQPQTQYQPQQQYQQPQAQYQTSQTINWVSGETGAKAYAVAPGASVLLMDSEQSRFYIKSADASGMPLPLRVFDYTERQQQTQAPAQVAQPINTQDYVTRKEFDDLLARLEERKQAPRKKKEEVSDGEPTV